MLLMSQLENTTGLKESSLSPEDHTAFDVTVVTIDLWSMSSFRSRSDQKSSLWALIFQ